jgi:hypothetical protein
MLGAALTTKFGSVLEKDKIKTTKIEKFLLEIKQKREKQRR